MARFMLILHETPSQEYRNLSPEQIQEIVEQYRSWADRLASAGKMAGGAKLADEGGKWMTKKQGRVCVVDGPYIETKEVVGGYFMIHAENYTEAVELTNDCPHLAYGWIEVRQVDPTAPAE
jgi:hypothetical protein